MPGISGIFGGGFQCATRFMMIRRPPAFIKPAGWGFPFRTLPSRRFRHIILVKKKGAFAPYLLMHTLQRLSKTGATSERGVAAVRRLVQLFRGDFFPSRNMKLLVQCAGMLDSTLYPVRRATLRILRAAYDSPASTVRPAGVFTLCAAEKGLVVRPPLLRAERSRRCFAISP